MPQQPQMDNRPLKNTRRGPFYYFIRFIQHYFLVITILILILVAGGFYELGRYSIYSQYPQLSQQNQANAILTKVGALIQLPQNEVPSMATIVDAEAAKKGQPFLADAQNGDILIVYPNSFLAILYRPSTDKLIAVGPVNTTPTPQSTTAIPPASSTTSSSKTATKTNATTATSTAK